jgi:hypothetical protein
LCRYQSLGAGARELAKVTGRHLLDLSLEKIVVVVVIIVVVDVQHIVVGLNGRNLVKGVFEEILVIAVIVRRVTVRDDSVVRLRLDVGDRCERRLNYKLLTLPDGLEVARGGRDSDSRHGRAERSVVQVLVRLALLPATTRLGSRLDGRGSSGQSVARRVDIGRTRWSPCRESLLPQLLPGVPALSVDLAPPVGGLGLADLGRYLPISRPAGRTDDLVGYRQFRPCKRRLLELGSQDLLTL